MTVVDTLWKAQTCTSNTHERATVSLSPKVVMVARRKCDVQAHLLRFHKTSSFVSPSALHSSPRERIESKRHALDALDVQEHKFKSRKKNVPQKVLGHTRTSLGQAGRIQLAQHQNNMD